MSNLYKIPIILLILFLLVIGCTTNPYTKRSQLLLISESQEISMGEETYAKVLNDPKNTISKDPKEVDPVKRVAKRIIAVAKKSKYSERAKAFSWDISVIKDDSKKNAWALPGGKIAVYTGIFSEAKNENGLAAIIGHEIVHALARHGGERFSQNVSANLGISLAATALGLSSGGGNLAMQALGVGVLLPYSRGHESEADYIGLLLAAQAGYDPFESIHVWKRMSKTSTTAPPEFLSTHPAHSTRINNLEKWMPEARAIYKRSQKAVSADLPKVTPNTSLKNTLMH